MSSVELTPNQQRILLDVARHTIRAELGSAGNLVIPQDPVLHKPAGCFVTLHTLANHRLRGCVGRLDCQDPLIEAVRHSARSVLHDPRFVSCPVRLEELPHLEIEITVVFPLRPAADCMDFDLLNEGIYLTVGNRGGCFLPQVARETGWDKQQLLQRLCTEKLGLPPDAWRDPSARLMKFSTLLIGPEPFEPARTHQNENPQQRC